MSLTFQFDEVKMLPINDLELHPDFNRVEIKERTIKWIDDDPNPDKFGVLLGARLNGNGKVAIYDGGHRLTWLQRHEYDGLVPVAVAKETDPGKIAKLFVDVNVYREGVNPYERYVKALKWDDPYAIFARDVIAKTTWQIGPKAADNIVMPKPLEMMWKKDPEYLALTVDLVHEIWAEQFKSTDGSFLQGVFGAIRAQGLDRDKFIERLRSYVPADLLARAADRRLRERGTVAKNVEREILRVYRAPSVQATPEPIT